MKRGPGRPRSETVRRAILASTLRLLQEHGFAELQIEAVAVDAKVGRATIYRWWPDKASLVVEAFFDSVREDLHYSNTGSLASDIQGQLEQLVRVLRSERGRALSAVIGGGQSDARLLAAFQEHFAQPRRQEGYQTLRRAIERGELSPEIDLEFVLLALYGPIYWRFVSDPGSVTPSLVRKISGFVLAALSHQSGRG